MTKILFSAFFAFSALSIMGLAGQFVATVPATHGASAGSWTTLTNACHAQSGSASVTTETCTWGSSVPSGTSIFCGVGNFVSTALTYSVTDSASEAYSSVGPVITLATASPSSEQIWWLAKTTASVTTMTVSVTGGNAAFLAIVCQSATDSGASPAIDGAQCSGTNSAGTGGWNPPHCITPGSSLTLAATDYVLGSTYQAGGTCTAGAGFTLGATAAAGIYDEYGLFSSTVSPTIGGCEENGIFVAAAFKP